MPAARDRSFRPLVRQVSKAINDASGIRVDGHSLRFLGQDVAAAGRYLLRREERREFVAAVASAATTLEWFDVSRAHFGVGPVQVPEEILGLIDLAAANSTRVACEIGAHDAGTSLLFCRGLPDLRTFVAMDLYVKNRWRLRRVALDGQEMHAIDGDSGHPRTVERLRRVLAGRQLDLLLIDGDHAFAGVRRDFLAYRHLVRAGGLIAFHDIQPVVGRSTRWVGGVPDFWRFISRLYSSKEFVADPAQEGLGIGVITYDPTVPVPPVADATDLSSP